MPGERRGQIVAGTEGMQRRETHGHHDTEGEEPTFAFSVARGFFDAGGYPISLRITWAAAFRVNGGGWEGLDPVTGTFESRHQVRESWPVGVNNATTLRPAP